jgi:four helix bundle protein
MKPAKIFTDFIVWQKAHKFVLEAYKYTLLFPKEEIYALTSQFRRAAVSIAANIAEGFRKKSDKDKIKFYNSSRGLLKSAGITSCFHRI